MRDRPPTFGGVASIPVMTFTQVCEALDLSLFEFEKLNLIEEIMLPFIRKQVKRKTEKEVTKDKFKFKPRR